ncbi:MAG: L-fucose/L-arabinose isomerase family protein [bacterium]|nr:L-fucose/L-arabinose isomerase family protein [bacterium]
MSNPTCKVGLFSIGLAAYWPQFDGLEKRLTDYGAFVGKKLAKLGVEIIDVGMVDNQPKALAASDRFIREGVDLIVCYVTTYATSSQVIPAVQQVGRPVLVLNLQPTAQLNYAQTGTGEWLANCQACCIPEISNAFARCNIDFHVVTGLLGLTEKPECALANEVTAKHPAAIAAWKEIEAWLHAVQVKRTLNRSRIGFLGHTYPGMMDMYSDFTQHTAFLGTHIEVLEMEDLQVRVDAVTDPEINAIRQKTETLFEISEDSPADPLARKPTEEEMGWACRVAAGLDRLVEDFDLHGLSYYYRGWDGNPFEHLGSSLILGCSLLTARGIPCSGEGDLKNCMAMKVMDTLGAGGSFTELIVMDFEDPLLLMGHDGPFHMAIADGKPILRGLGLFHGKRGGGVSVEARVKQGPITILGLTQTRDGQLTWLCDEGWSLPGEILTLGNTNSRIRFTENPDDHFDLTAWMNRWAELGPTHHVALGVGHQANKLAKLAKLLHTEIVRL